MNPSIYLSCLLVLLVSLAWTACGAQSDQEFLAERTRLVNIFGNPSVHKATKKRNFPAAVEFYGKYRNRFTIRPELRAKADMAWSEYKKEKAHERTVEGVPLQGPWWIFIPAIVEIILEETGYLTTTEPTRFN